MIEQIQWYGHGSFAIQGPPLIYINPYRVSSGVFLADVVLIGHDHYDHFSPADIEKVRGPETRIITNERVAEQIAQCEILRPWQTMRIDRAGIKGVPAYSPNDMRHPKEDGGLGFVISMNFYDIYYAGDTGLIPEMRHINPDIAILPIDGRGTMDIDTAIEAVKLLRPRWVIPCNWGGQGEGATAVDAQQFKERVGGRAQVILPKLSS